MQKPSRFYQYVFLKRLSSKTGLYGHRQYYVDGVDEWLHVFYRRIRIQDDARLRSELSYTGEGSGDIVVRFHMDRDLVGSRSNKGFDMLVRVVEHEMNIEEKRRLRAEVFDDLRTESEVGNEVAVHDIDVQPLDPGRFGCIDSVDKTAMIGSEERRS